MYICMYICTYVKWCHKLILNTQSAQISQKQDEHNTCYNENNQEVTLFS